MSRLAHCNFKNENEELSDSEKQGELGKTKRERYLLLLLARYSVTARPLCVPPYTPDQTARKVLRTVVFRSFLSFFFSMHRHPYTLVSLFLSDSVLIILRGGCARCQMKYALLLCYSVSDKRIAAYIQFKPSASPLTPLWLSQAPQPQSSWP